MNFFAPRPETIAALAQAMALPSSFKPAPQPVFQPSGASSAGVRIVQYL